MTELLPGGIGDIHSIRYDSKTNISNIQKNKHNMSTDSEEALMYVYNISMFSFI